MSDWLRQRGRDRRKVEHQDGFRVFGDEPVRDQAVFQVSGLVVVEQLPFPAIDAEAFEVGDLVANDLVGVGFVQLRVNDRPVLAVLLDLADGMRRDFASDAGIFDLNALLPVVKFVNFRHRLNYSFALGLFQFSQIALISALCGQA